MIHLTSLLNNDDNINDNWLQSFGIKYWILFIEHEIESLNKMWNSFFFMFQYKFPHSTWNIQNDILIMQSSITIATLRTKYTIVAQRLMTILFRIRINIALQILFYDKRQHKMQTELEWTINHLILFGLCLWKMQLFVVVAVQITISYLICVLNMHGRATYTVFFIHELHLILEMYRIPFYQSLIFCVYFSEIQFDCNYCFCWCRVSYVQNWDRSQFTFDFCFYLRNFVWSAICTYK